MLPRKTVFISTVLLSALIACAPSFCLAESTPSSSQSTQKAISHEQRIKELQWALNAAKKSRSASASTVAKEKAKLDQLTESSKTLRDDFFAVKRDLETLKAKAGDAPTLEQKSRIRNEELKFILTESKFDAFEKQTRAIETSIEKATQSIEKDNQRMARYAKKIKQQQTLSETEKKTAFQKKNAELLAKEEQLRIRDQASQSEVEKLKQLLKEKEIQIVAAKAKTDKILAEQALADAERSRQAESTKQKIADIDTAKTSKNSVKKIQKDTPVAAVAASESDKQIDTAKDSTSESKVAPITGPSYDQITDKSVLNKDYALAAMKHFDTTMAIKKAGGNRKSSARTRVLKFKNIDKRSVMKSEYLEAEGNFHYKGKLHLAAGKYMLQVGDYKTEIVVPAEKAKGTFIVLLDNRPEAETRLDVFDRELLN